MSHGGRKKSLETVVEKEESRYFEAFREEQDQKDKVMALDAAATAATREVSVFSN